MSRPHKRFTVITVAYFLGGIRFPDLHSRHKSLQVGQIRQLQFPPNTEIAKLITIWSIKATKVLFTGAVRITLCLLTKFKPQCLSSINSHMFRVNEEHPFVAKTSRLLRGSEY